MPNRPVLYVIACGGHPAADLPQFVTWAQGESWDACVIATPAGSKFLDAPRLAELTGHPVRDDYKKPEDPDLLPFPPDAFVVAPATFNTINKWASEVSDTLALGLLNEALCAGQPIIAVPNPNITLARHPAFVRSVAFLRENKVRVLFDPNIYPLPKPNEGESSRDLFPWYAVQSELPNSRPREMPAVRSPACTTTPRTVITTGAGRPSRRCQPVTPRSWWTWVGAHHARSTAVHRGESDRGLQADDLVCEFGCGRVSRGRQA